MSAHRSKWTALLLLPKILIWVMWTSATQASALPERQAVAITEVTVIDLERDRSIGPRTVLVDDGRIVSITAPRDARIPVAAQRVDGRGRFLIPGLVDMHVHLFNNHSRRPPNDWTFPLFIANGVTSIREMNAAVASISLVNRWRKCLDDGELAAPRILAAGVSVRGTSPDDAVRQVDAAADAGVDFIKVFSEVPDSNWHAILNESRTRTLPVVGHAPAGVSLLGSANEGQRSNEHLMQAFEACSSTEDQLLEERRGLDGDALLALRDRQELRALETFDWNTCRRIGKSLASTGQVQVPTLVLPYEESIRNSGASNNDPRSRYLRADELARWKRLLASLTPSDLLPAQRRWQVARKIVLTFHRAGVTMLSGTDAPMPGVYPGFSLHEEMALLVKAGLTPREALLSATLGPAKFFGITAESGSVAVGKRADLVLLDGDPTRNISNTRRVRAVLLDGRLLRRAALDALLEAAAGQLQVPKTNEPQQSCVGLK